MTLHHKPSLLTHRPKTSSAALDDASGHGGFNAHMKRTASQTFSAQHVDVGAYPQLASVQEGMMRVDYPPSHASHSSSLSRTGSVLKTGYKQICRRLSTSSSASSSSSVPRRPSLSSLLDNPLSSRKQSMDVVRLQHHDSGMPTPTLSDTAVTGVHSKFSPFKRFGSTRHRRPATSGPSGEYARYNPVPPPIPTNYPTPPPGQAARAAAAAANNERLLQKREVEEQQQTRAFLTGTLLCNPDMDDVIKDSESGVGMQCSSPIVRADSVQEKKFDPIQYLPAEIVTMVLANLDAPSLVKTEQVSKGWYEAATSPHVWKHIFLRRFEPEVHVQPEPILMGGAGIGKLDNRGNSAPGQDWCRMYKARMTINRRWKGTNPSAIYLNGHTDSVYCCQFDEDKIITGSRDRTIRVWDMKTYRCLKVIGGPSSRPQPNTPGPLEVRKEMVVSYPSMNGTREGDAIYHVPEDYHEASILCLQYDNQIMVTGSSDFTCIVWDITGPEYIPLQRLSGHSAGVLDVALDDKHIISCSKDATINVWDRKTFRKVRTLTGHRGPVNAVQLRGNLLVSASGDGVAKLWNLESGQCIKEFPSQDRGLAAVEFSDDAKYVLAGGNDHVVYKFDAMTGQLLYTSPKHGGLVRSLFLDAHNGRVISGSYDQSIRIADYATGETFGTYENWTTSWILSAKSDYRRVVATSQDGRALILDFGWETEGVATLIGS
jgi:F-box and WD-40 domain protein 1/11